MSRSPQPRPGTRPAAEKLRSRYAWLNRFSDDELREISFCFEGHELDEEEEYFDISHPESGIVRGRSGARVPKDSCLVPRSRVTPAIWGKLTAR